MTTGMNSRRFRALMIRLARSALRVARRLTEESPCPRFTSKVVAGTAKTTPHPARARQGHLPLTTQNPIASPVRTPVLRRTNLQAHRTRHLALLATLQAPRLTLMVALLTAIRAKAFGLAY